MKISLTSILNKIFIIAILISTFFILRGCWNTYCKGTTWEYNVTVTYQYENEDTTRTITYKDSYSYNNSVKSVVPVYTSLPGYNDKLVVNSYTIRNGVENAERHTRIKELLNTPDFKVKVLDITYQDLN